MTTDQLRAGTPHTWRHAPTTPLADPAADVPTVLVDPRELAAIVAEYARTCALRVEDARQELTAADVADRFARLWGGQVVWVNVPASEFRLAGCRTRYSILWIDGGWEIIETPCDERMMP